MSNVHPKRYTKRVFLRISQEHIDQLDALRALEGDAPLAAEMMRRLIERAYARARGRAGLGSHETRAATQAPAKAEPCL